MDRTCGLTAVISFYFIYLQTTVKDWNLSRTGHLYFDLVRNLQQHISFLPNVRHRVIQLLISYWCDPSRHRLWLTEYHSKQIPTFLPRSLRWFRKQHLLSLSDQPFEGAHRVRVWSVRPARPDCPAKGRKKLTSDKSVYIWTGQEISYHGSYYQLTA